MASSVVKYTELTDQVAWFLLRRRWGRVLLRERLWLACWADYLWAEPECLVQELIRHRAWQALERLATEGDA